MATIREKGDFQWHVQVRKKGFPPQTKTFPTKAEAEAWSVIIESEMVRGVFTDRAEAEATSLFDALERYEREISRQKKGHAQEKYRIATWKENALAKRSLASLRGADFAKCRDDRLADGISAATVRLDLALVSHLFTIASKEWGIPVQNPVTNIRLPRANNARERRLEPSEEKALLAALDNPAGKRSNNWIKPIVIFAIETAVRQSEMFSTFDAKKKKTGLWWENIYLKKKVARIIDTKNGDAYRDIPLSSRALAILTDLPRSIDGKVFQTTEYALKQSWNRSIKRARQTYEQSCKDKGFEPSAGFMHDLHFHDLRHEGTSRLAEKLALHELMKVTGHKDTRIIVDPNFQTVN